MNKPSAAKVGFKKVKAKSVSFWKKKTDSVVSRFVRHSYANERGEVQCYTCGKIGTVATMQCGHFVSRNNSATRFDMQNLRPQCAGCNIWGRGRYDVFADKLMEELGVESFKELLKRGRSIKSFSVKELQGIIETYSVDN